MTIAIYEFSVIMPLERRQRRHSVVFYHVAADNVESADVKLRDYLEDRCTRYEHISAGRAFGDVRTVIHGTCTPEQLLAWQGKPIPERESKTEPKPSTRPLGDSQLRILQKLLARSKGWYSTCGWLWDTESGTRRICESLHARCLVDREGEGRSARYTINDHGRAALGASKKDN